MRKIVIYCLLLPGILSLVCCQGLFGVDTDRESPTTFTATIGPSPSTSTKTTLGGSPGGDRAVLWNADDKVMIGGEVYTLTDGEGTTSGTLEGSGAALSEGVYKAYYPAGIASLELPSEQTRVSGRIDNLPMYAQSSGTDLQFYNLCAVLNLRLRGTGTVSEIKVTSTEHPLWGPFEVKGSGTSSDGWYARMTGSTEDLKTVILKCTPGVVLSETEDADFFIALPEGTYGKGTLTVGVWEAGASSPLKSYRNDGAPATGSKLERSRVYHGGGGSATSFDLGLEEIAWDGRIPAPLPNLEGVNWDKPNYLPGVFSVSDNEQVYFSKGNLQVNYTGTGSGYTREWLFSENQWDVFYPTAEELNSLPNPPEGTTVKLSHFGWATAGHKNPGGDYGCDNTHAAYEPHTLLLNNLPYGPSRLTWHNRVGTLMQNNAATTWNAERAGGLSPSNEVRSYCDWGIHFNSDGIGDDKRYDGIFFTLSVYQWEYLLNQRLSFDQKRGFARIDINPDPAQETFVNGLVIVPDVWQCPDGCSFSPGLQNRGYDTNTYYAATDWPLMEASGAVFLPLTGHRSWGTEGTIANWPYVGDLHPGGDGTHVGRYWSSSASYPGDDSSYESGAFEFARLLMPDPNPNAGTNAGTYRSRLFGMAVRLVRYANQTP